MECHNYEFEEYLKKNNLYILNGNKYSKNNFENREYDYIIREISEQVNEKEKNGIGEKKRKGKKNSTKISTKKTIVDTNEF